MHLYSYDGKTLQRGILLQQLQGRPGILWPGAPILISEKEFPDIRAGDTLYEGYIKLYRAGTGSMAGGIILPDSKPRPSQVMLFLHSSDSRIKESRKFIGDRKWEHKTSPSTGFCGIERFIEGQLSIVNLIEPNGSHKVTHWLACYKGREGKLFLTLLQTFEEVEAHLRQYWLPGKSPEQVDQAIASADEWRFYGLRDFLRNQTRR